MTKNDKPVSRLVRDDETPGSLCGATRGCIEIVGDIIEPIGVAWEANIEVRVEDPQA